MESKKSLGQNFLIDKNLSKKIINQLEIKNRYVLEIGPGLGSLTNHIVDRKPKKLYLVEKDYYLAEILKQRFNKNQNISVIKKDFLKLNISSLKNLVIISNLPYNLSTKIILYLFKNYKNIDVMILMIQKEVALKFDYRINSMNKYKFLTKIVSSYTRCFDVSPKVFKPKPKVNSTVVKFKFYKKDINYEKAKIFSNLIFKNVRKKIYKNINNIGGDNNLLNKRVNQLSINELLEIYNSF